MSVIKKQLSTVGNVFSLNQIGGRKNVEDSISPPNDTTNPGVFLVCDGVGGNSCGEVASDLAVKSFYKIFTEEYDSITSKRDFDSLLDKAILSFKSKVQEYVAEHPASKNTSTTLTLVVIKDSKVYLAWCGDSRIYHLRNGNILYRTADHSLVEELIASGVITAEEALTHPQKNVITKSLDINIKEGGASSEVLEDLKKNDWILMCTDGLLEQFKESSFSSLLSEYNSEINYAAEINSVCEGKTGDNFSMYLINYGASVNRNNTSSAPAAKSSSGAIIGLLIFLIAAAATWYFLIYKKNNNVSTAASATADTASTGLMISAPDTVKLHNKRDSNHQSAPVKTNNNTAPAKINSSIPATQIPKIESKKKPQPTTAPVVPPDAKIPPHQTPEAPKKEGAEIK